MTSRFLGVALSLTAAVALPTRAQTSPSPAGTFARTPAGVEYQLFRRDAAGRYVPRPLAPAGDAPYASRAGKFLTLFLSYRTGRDSVLMESRRMMAQPMPMPLPETPVPGSLEQALGLLLPGDSAVFRFQADSIFTKQFHQPVPPFVRNSGNVLLAYVSARALLNEAEVMALQQQLQAEQQQAAQAQSAQQLKQDEAEILAYLKSKKATARKTAGGTYYLITKPGTGPLPQTGQTVSVRYKGSILSTGKVFDATERRGDTPFPFTLGVGQVIPGWDQGVAMLPKGAKAVLYIPSPLGYGARGAGTDIPPNSVLRFEVEVVDIK